MKTVALIQKQCSPVSLLGGRIKRSSQQATKLFQAFHKVIKLHDEKLGFSASVTPTNIVLLFRSSTAFFQFVV